MLSDIVRGPYEFCFTGPDSMEGMLHWMGFSET